jgi:hypothetical protein
MSHVEESKIPLLLHLNRQINIRSMIYVLMVDAARPNLEGARLLLVIPEYVNICQLTLCWFVWSFPGVVCKVLVGMLIMVMMKMC